MFICTCGHHIMGSDDVIEEMANDDEPNNTHNTNSNKFFEPNESKRLKPINGDHQNPVYGTAISTSNVVGNGNGNIEIGDNNHSKMMPSSDSSGLANGGGGGGSAATGEFNLNETNRIKRHSLTLKRGDTELSIDHGGMQRFLPTFMHFAFADREAEQLYQEYYSNEKRNDFKALIVIVIFVNLVLLGLHLLSSSWNHSDLSHQQLIILGSCLVLAVFLFILCLRRSRDALASRLWSLIPFALWLVMLVQIICDLCIFIGRPPEPSGSISWLLLYSYATYVIFPLRFRICCALSILMAILHSLFIITFATSTYMLANQIFANLIIIVSVNLLSTMSFFFYERQQRRAFLETRQSLETKLTLEEQSQEQERLLLSVLPKHVAAEIRQDLGAVVEGQFHKIYMRYV